MDSNRCNHCGEPLSEPGARCPKCGPAEPTVMVRKPGVGAGPKDTDIGAAGFDTIAFGVNRGELATGGPARPDKERRPNEEHFDFLAPPQSSDELGRLGGHRILRVLGAGGMGVVFEAEDVALARRVAIKAMLPTLAVSKSARERFHREAKAAAAVEHPRIVPIYQVGEDRGVPFLVMPLLKGESLEDRLTRDGRLSVADALRIALEIAEALAAAHEKGLIHRDVKPANVWLDGADGGVKLLDFGLARAMESDTPLTQQGSIVGTPAFMAPEQADGAAVDHRVDLFSLGCILYRMTTGTLPFRGVSAVSTLLAITSQHPAPPRDMLPNLPAPLSDLIMNLLEKKPDNRPASARLVIEMLRVIAGSSAVATGEISSLQTQLDSPRTAVSHAPRRGRNALLLGGIAAVILIGIAAFVLPGLLKPKDSTPVPAPPVDAPAVVEIGITYGTEKHQWFAEVLPEFAATPEGKSIKVNLLPMGSLEGAHAVVQEDKKIHVWSPASSLYRDVFRRDWKFKHPGQEPILKQESLASTPIVFVMWKERYDGFIKKYKIASFRTIKEAMEEPDGWAGIAGKPDWGRFRFGQTNPDQSNSGLMTLVLTAYDFKNKGRDLTMEDVSRKAIQSHLEGVKRELAGTSNSTGNLMKDMVAKGPSGYDAVAVYENLAIDYLKQARGRWGELYVVYPGRTMWSDNPYYILDVPWSSKEQRQAAETLLRFLMSEPIQRKALKHGFRPANIDIPIRNDPQSPFVLHKDSGLSVDVPSICPNPSEPVLDALLKSWASAK